MARSPLAELALPVAPANENSDYFRWAEPLAHAAVSRQ